MVSTKFDAMVSTMINFDEGLKLRYYLNNVNRRGYGVVYASYTLNGKCVRVSTHVKVREAYWSNGMILIPTKGMRSERILHQRASERLEKLKIEVDEVFCSYLNNITDIETLQNDVRSKINPMSKQSIKPRSIVSILPQTVRETISNPKSQRSILIYVTKFEEFLKTKGLDDDIKTLNQKTIEAYRDWIYEVQASSTAKNNLSNLLTVIKNTEKKFDVNFNVKRDLVTKISDNRTSEEKQDNIYALTHDDIAKLERVEGLNEIESLVRDLFLIQCFTGVRYEDLTKILNTKKHTESNGVTYAIFKSSKTKIKHIIPLNDVNLYPNALALILKHSNLDSVVRNHIYNATLKRIAKKANLNTIISHSIERNGKVEVTEMKVYEKISSHWGRHSCITNLQRVFHMQPSDIKMISGHADEKLINSIYTNTTINDKISMISKGLQNGKQSNTNNENSIIDLTEGKQVLRYLGVEIEPNLTFENVVEKVREREGMLMETYGVKVSTLKELFNYALPIEKRKQALGTLLEVLK